MNETESHPLEEVFDIEPNTTATEIDVQDKYLPSTVVRPEEYDEKDSEIEDEFQEVYDKAMRAFDEQMQNIKNLEGKYMARNTEVASVMLATALQAAKEKANMKKHKDGFELKKVNAGKPTTINQNVIVDRNEILKLLQQEDE